MRTILHGQIDDNNALYRTPIIIITLVLFLSIPGFAMTLSHWDWHLPRAELIEQWAERYTRDVRPDISIETSLFSWDEFWDKLPIAIATGVPPDFMQFHNEKYVSFIGMLAAFPDEIFNYAQLAEDYFLFNEAFLFDAKMYFFPAGIMSAGIFYNVDHLGESGINEPALTWTEIVNEAKKLTRFQDEYMVRAGLQILPSARFVYADLVYQLGGSLFTDASANLLSDESMEATNLLLQIHEAQVGPGGAISSPGEFHTGQVSMRYEWTWFNGDMQHHKDDIRFRVAPLPTFSGESIPARGRNNYEAGLAVPYNVEAERQLEAFQFIKWLYDQDEFYVELNRILGRIPGRPALWSDPALLQDSVFQMLSQQAIYTVYPGPLPSWYFNVGLEAWNKMLNENIAPNIAMEQAQTAANARWVDEPASFIIENSYVAP